MTGKFVLSYGRLPVDLLYIYIQLLAWDPVFSFSSTYSVLQ